MRTYFIEKQSPSGSWSRGAKEYLSCAKAHRAARRLAGATRVIMVMSKVNLKDLHQALKWQGRRDS